MFSVICKGRQVHLGLYFEFMVILLSLLGLLEKTDFCLFYLCYLFYVDCNKLSSRPAIEARAIVSRTSIRNPGKMFSHLHDIFLVSLVIRGLYL